MRRGPACSRTHRRADANGRPGLRPAFVRLVGVTAAVFFVVLLVLVVSRWAPLWHLDESSSRSANAFVRRHGVLIDPLRATTYVLHPWVFRLFIAAMAAWLAHRGERRLALWALTTLVVAGVLSPLLKVLVARPRPRPSTAIAHASGGSFPSGHALIAVVGTVTIVLILLPILPILPGVWRVVAWVAAGLVSASAGAFRVLLGVHYVSDVVAGLLLGAATVAAFGMWRPDPGRPPGVTR